MRLSLAILFFVVIPKNFTYFSTSSLYFFVSLFLGVTFQDQEGYCCHVLLFAIVMDSVVVGSWIQKSQCVELSPGNWKKAYGFEHSRCKL